MRRRPNRSLLIPALPLLALLGLPDPMGAGSWGARLFGAAPALAQVGPPRQPPQPSSAPRPPPPALPGLAARRSLEPIPGDPTQNLAPNAALFDAIARGDLGAVRDAVARGANLDARNVLGLTPVDTAVDQGRNEIAFYLLSARGAGGGGGGGRGEPLPDSLPSAPPPMTAAPAAAPPRQAPRAPMNTPPGAAPLVPEAPRNARLWAGDGGAPAPEVGFLGFDAGRPAGAAPPEASRAEGRGRRG